VANEVEKNEPTAESSHVANQARQIALAKMMAEVHAESDIGKRQGVTHCIGPQYGNWRGDTGVRVDVYSNNLDAKPAPYFFQNEARGTSHIQNTMDRERILADGADHQVCVTQPTMDSGEVPVCALD
jgi:hypothetical protein